MFGMSRMWLAVTRAIEEGIGLPEAPKYTYEEYAKSLYPVAYWKLDDIDLDSANDDFTGSEGAVPNKKFWSKYVSSTTVDYVELNQNRAKFHTQSTAVTYPSSSLTTKYALRGDFDIQWDLDTLECTGGGNWEALANLVVLDGTNKGNYFRFERIYDGTHRIKVATNHPSWTNLSLYTTGDDVFSLRVTRIGDTWTFYRDLTGSGNDWTSQYSTTDVDYSGDIYIAMSLTISVSKPNSTAYLDNFIINSVESLRYYVAIDELDIYDADYINEPTLDATGLLVNDNNTSCEFNSAGQHTPIPLISTVKSLVMLVKLPTQDIDWISAYAAYDDNTNRGGFDLTSYTTENWKPRIVSVSGGTSLYLDNRLDDSAIHHVVLTFDGVNSHAYVDSVENSTTLTGSCLYVAGVIDQMFGAYRFDSSYFSNGIKTIDEISFYDYELSQTEITNLYSLSMASEIVSKPLYFDYVQNLLPVAYWRLGESSGTHAYDISGNHYHGTYVNTPTLGTTGLLVGDSDTAVTFNGTDEYIGSINVPRFINGTDDVPFSFSCILETYTLANYKGAMFGKWNSSIANSGEYYFGLGDTGDVIFQLLSGTTANRLRINSIKTLNINTKYHITITYDASKIIGGLLMYINGVEQPVTQYVEGTYTGMYVAVGSAVPELGVILRTDVNYYRYFDGIIDDFSIFSKVLTATEIKEMYLLSQGISITPVTYNDVVRNLLPIAYWKLDEISPPANIDDDFSGIDGEIPNPDLWKVSYGDPKILSNKLRFTTNNRERIDSVYNITDDFSIEYYMDLTTFPADRSLMHLLITAENGDNWYIRMDNGTSLVASSGNTINSVWGGGTTSGTLSLTSTGLKCVRTSGSIALYYYDSSWVLLWTSPNTNTQNMKVTIDCLSIGSNPSIIVDIYDFKVNSGTIITVTANDELGNYDGTYVNTPNLDSASLVLQDNGTSATFNGTDEYISGSDSGLPSGGSARSICSLVQGLSSLALLAYGTLISSQQIAIITDANGNIGLAIYSSNIYYESSLHDGNVHHVIIVLPDSGTLNDVSFYVDGVLLTSIYSSSSPTTAYNTVLDGDFYISRDNGGVYYAGSHDELSIFDYALTQEEVTQLYNASRYVEYQLTIDHTKVPEDLYNFPMLINLDTLSGITSVDTTKVLEALHNNNADDDFDGINGADADPKLWQDSYATAGTIYTDTIQNNKLRFDVTDWPATDYSNITKFSQFQLRGDFDISIDVHDILGDSQLLYAKLQVASTGLTNCYISLLTGGSYDKVASYVGSGQVYYGSALTEASLRIARVGTTYTSYYSTTIGGAWVQGQTAVGTDLDTSIYLRNSISSTSPGATQTDFNNFKVNSGTILWSLNEEEYPLKLQTLYGSSKPDYAYEIKALNPVAYWRLGEDSGTEAKDISGNNYHGTYVNTPTLGTTGLLTNDKDTAVAFASASTEYVSLPSATTELITTDFTITLLINTASLAYQQLFTFNTNNIFVLIRFNETTTGDIRFYCFGSVKNGDFIVNTTNTGLLHITLTGTDGGSLIAYINGIEVGSDTTEGFSNSGAQLVNTIASNRNLLQTVDGTIDEVAVFDTALTQSQITRLYNKSIDELNNSIERQYCNVELDRWDYANNEAQIWVKVPHISKDTDTVISLVADLNNTDTSFTGYTGEGPAKQVWTEYDAVYHLSIDGRESTVNGLDGTLQNIDSTNIVDFGIGKGMNFNGTDEWIDIGLQSKFNLLATEDMTVETMLETIDVVAAQRALQTRGTDTGATGGFQHRFSASQISSGIGNSGITNQVGVTAETLVNNIPYTTTWTFNNSLGYMDVVHNGVDVAEVNSVVGDMTDVTIVSSRNTTIGCAWNDAATQSQFMSGKLKEVRFSKSLKSYGWENTNYLSTKDNLISFDENTYASIYNTLLSGYTPSFYWRLNDSNLVAVDETATTNGTINIGITQREKPLISDSNTFSMLFNSSKSIQLGDIETDVYTDKTITFLARFTDLASNQIIFKEGGTTNGWGIGIQASNFRLGTSEGGVLNIADYSTATYNTTDIYHFVGIIDTTNSKIQLYIDDVLVIDTTATIGGHNGTADAAIATPWGDGSSAYNNPINGVTATDEHFNGWLDEVAIFNRVLTTTEITDLYNAS